MRIIHRTLSYPLQIQYNLVNASGRYPIGTGSSSDGKVAFGGEYEGVPIPRFYRVGMVESIPWLYKKVDPSSNDVVVDKGFNSVAIYLNIPP